MMIRKLLSVLVLAAVVASCGNNAKHESASTNASSDAVKVEFTSLVEKPGDYTGKTISVEGKVVHVCTHSGKKLFIVGENPDVRLFIQAGENMPKFPMDLLGSTVVVEGTLINTGGSAAAAEGTGMVARNKVALAADTCETATALASQVALADVVMDYKSHVVK